MQLGYPENKKLPYAIVLITYALYVMIFAFYRQEIGMGASALAVFPVIAAGWYFGMTGGIMSATLSILTQIAFSFVESGSRIDLLYSPANLIEAFILFFIGLVMGGPGTVTRQHRNAIRRLENYERERQSHTDFLESLNEITARALKADSLNETLKILLERIGKLFQADNSFFSFWDETKRTPSPTAAHGSLRDAYPYQEFQPDEPTLTRSVLEAKLPIAVRDIGDSPYISPRVAAIFPCRSMLGIPLIVQQRKLGALLLGYTQTHSFSQNDLLHAELTAEQLALVLSKSLLLEEERKQVKQLTVLHDIALISIEVDNEDELLHRVTDVIGQNLFPANFGILLLDEQASVLRVHPSYRFFSEEERHMMDIPLDEGVTGQVARTGQPQRLGNVRLVSHYLDVDERTLSELCVPIKFKERILGVINAESTRRDAFTEDDERLLVTLAGQVATALEQIRRAQAERKWLDQLAHSNGLIYALAQITTHIEKGFSIDDIIQNLGAELSRINLTCIMAVYDQELDVFTVNYTSMEPQSLAIVENGLGSALIRYTFSADQLGAGNLLQPTTLSNPVDEIQMLFARLPRQGVSEILHDIGVGLGIEPLRLPLIFKENLLGLLWIWGPELTKTDLPIMSIFAKQIGISLERARLFEKVQSLALTDPLTGLHNRRSIFELGRVEFSRALRMERDFSCMMLDLDNFKQINDTYGHPIGDQVLREFANRCKCSLREIDLVGRYGGEELIILLPETDRELALIIAERLRASIAAAPIKISDREITLTVSIGVAMKDENSPHLETLIARADQAMYIAKHKGRNQVAISK